MEDRNAYVRRPLIRGVAEPEARKANLTRKGVPAASYYGEEADRGGQAGVPVQGTGPVRRQVAACAAVTKAGNPCRAHPVHGEDYCVGHLRSYEPSGD